MELTSTRRRLIVALLAAVALLASGACRAEDGARGGLESPPAAAAPKLTPLSTIRAAFKNRASKIQVAQEGAVIRVLADDNDGSRHQRFIVKLADGQTLLLAHNIDLAPRVAGLKEGDRVAFFGEYAWNDKGGVIHWTHKDPAGKHVAGWILHKGKRYQ